MEQLDFYDCSCMIGRRKVVNPGSFHKVDDLVKRMNDCGIKRALVYHSMAREYNPVVGNGMLMEEIAKYDCLQPAWVIMPHHTGEFPEPGELIRQLREYGVKAVRMFPYGSEQNYSISEWNCGELLTALEEHGVPLFIGQDQLSWDELHALCSSHPKLKVVLTDVEYRIDRNIYPLLKKFEYLYMETIGYKVHQGIEEIVRHFGAERLIFGSGMPVYSGAAAVSMISYGKTSEKEKHMIAHENLERLLGGVKW